MAHDPLNRVTTMVDAVGTTTYAYTAGGQLWTEDGPFSNDTVTNSYTSRLRTGLALQQPTSLWTNGFWYDYAKRLTNVTSPAGTFSYQLVGQASRLSKLTLPNTSYITNTYDSTACLTGTWPGLEPRADETPFHIYCGGSGFADSALASPQAPQAQDRANRP